MREVRLGKAVFRERVVNVQKGRSHEIQVLEARAPLEQDFERVEIENVAGGCELTWTIRFRLKTPVLQSWLSEVVAFRARPRFKRFILRLKTHIETRVLDRSESAEGALVRAATSVS